MTSVSVARISNNMQCVQAFIEIILWYFSHFFFRQRCWFSSVFVPSKRKKWVDVWICEIRDWIFCKHRIKFHSFHLPLLASPQCFWCWSILSSAYCYVSSHKSGTYRSWMISIDFLCSYPWNQNTYFGYFNEIFISSIAGGFYLLMDGAILVLFISMCMQLRAFHGIIKQRIDNWKFIERNRDCDEKFICSLIDFHVSVQE